MSIESRLEIMMGHIDPDHRLPRAEQDNTLLKVEKTAGQALTQENTPSTPQTREVTPIPEPMLSKLSDGFHRATLYVRQLLGLSPSQEIVTPEKPSASIQSAIPNDAKVELFHAAVAKGDLATVKKLLSEDGSLANAKDRLWKNTPLRQAVSLGNSVEIVKTLLDHGAKVNEKADWLFDSTPLHAAVCYDKALKDRASYHKSLEIVRILLNRGADVNATDKDGNTPLHNSAKVRNLGIVQELINRGADVNARNHLGNTPLHRVFYTTGVGSIDVAQLLIASGADINSRNNSGHTPLHLVVNNFGFSLSNKDLIQFCIDRGAMIEAKDNLGITPLSYATINRRVPAIQILLDNGADIHTKDIKGYTPLHWAAQCGNLEAVQELIKRGANIHDRNGEGRTPLECAIAELERMEKSGKCEKSNAIGRLTKKAMFKRHCREELKKAIQELQSHL